MPNPVWPAALCPGGMELRLHKSGAQHKSPFTGSLQACDYLGEHWEANIQLHGEGRTRANSGLLDALLMRLSGGVNQIDIYHWRRPQPIGTLRGSPTLQVSTARGDTQLLLTVVAGSTLEPGDLIGAGIVGAGFQVFMVRSACVAAGTTLTVPIVNRVRGPIAANTAVVWDRPLLPVVMPKMGAGLSYQPGATLPSEVSLVESQTINSTILLEKSPGKASLYFTGLAPAFITQWSPVFDSTLGGWWDSRDVVNGAVASWPSRDMVAQTGIQATESAKPTKGATGVVFDGGDSISRPTSLSASAFLTGVTLPDGASASTAGKGWTCTGLAPAPDGTWWVANHGKARSTDSTFAPSLVHLSADFATILGEILLAPLYPGIGSVQGVVYDISDDTLWFADLAGVKVRHITLAGASVGDDITPSFSPNGIARDSAADTMWINQDASVGTQIEKRSCVDGSAVLAPTAGVTNQDQLFFVDETKTLLLSHGASNSAGMVSFYNATGATTLKLMGTINLSVDADAIEGIVWQGRTLYVANDGFFHDGTPWLNRILTFTITPPAANIVDVWCAVTVPATTGTDAIVTVGDCLSSGTVGWGLYTAGATDLRMFAHTGGTGTTTQDSVIGVSPSLTVPRIVYGRIDQTNDALTLWVDGVQIATDSGAALVGALGNANQLRIGNDVSSRQPTMTLLAIGYNMGLGSRLKIEGYLAHTFALTSQLQSDHPYKTVAP